MNQLIPFSFQHNVSLTIKREDLLHPQISGNKFRKLKYNIAEAKKLGYAKLLTFGGAYSNHIAATAAAAKEYGFEAIGVIRGEELAGNYGNNPTLTYAVQCGMALDFITREAYRNKTDPAFIERFRSKYGDFYLLPEGGTNELAIKGCEEILTDEDSRYTHICCAVGTGGTIAGLIRAAKPGQKVIGFPVLKNAALSADIATFAPQGNWELAEGYHYGGYGKVNDALIAFINRFYQNTGIPLDPVYTGKLVFGVIDLINAGYFPDNSSVLVIHTGGLQGIAGMNRERMRKKLTLIKT